MMISTFLIPFLVLMIKLNILVVSGAVIQVLEHLVLLSSPRFCPAPLFFSVFFLALMFLSCLVAGMPSV